MVTIKDIAKQAEVSTTTVSRVLNDYPDVNSETREKVLKIIKENNYRPSTVARSLSTNKSRTIGIFFIDHYISGLQHPFFREVIYGLGKKLGENGYDIVYFTNQHWGDSFSYLEKCKDRHVDGVVLMGVQASDPHLVKLLRSNLPTVFVDIDITGKNATYVISDNISGAKKAVHYLYELGHRRIGTILGIDSTKACQQRFNGYKMALEELGLPYKSEWVYEGNYSEEDSYQAIKNMFDEKNLPTAIFCQSDNMAIGAMRAIEEAGYKVPDDFSLIGFDNIEPGRYIRPALTTIAQKKEELGCSAAKLLLNMINKTDQRNSPIILPVELIERETCRKIE
ncbi:MAG: LacI family DNA-binding transcriptional regulator [Bacillota bacterium]